MVDVGWAQPQDTDEYVAAARDTNNHNNNYYYYDYYCYYYFYNYNDDSSQLKQAHGAQQPLSQRRLLMQVCRSATMRHTHAHRNNDTARDGALAPLPGLLNRVPRSTRTLRSMWSIVWLGQVLCCSMQVQQVLAMNTTPNITTTTSTTTTTTSTTKLCLPAGCFGESCDHWDSSPITPFDCLELEGTHGCDCSGCDCAFTVFPALDTTAAPIPITTLADVSTTQLPNTTADPSVENVCSDGTVAKVCFGDMEADELVALFGLPAFWLTVMVLVGFSHHIAALARAVKDSGGKKSAATKGKKGKPRLGSSSSASSRLEAGRLAPALSSKSRKILNYSFSKVARMTFLTHSRSWNAFCERE